MVRDRNEIAFGKGYKVDDINSELLASLLNYQNNMDTLSEDLEDFAKDFNDLEDEPDEDED